MKKIFLIFTILIPQVSGAFIFAGVPDTPFIQEEREFYLLPTQQAQDVRSIVVDNGDTVWAGTMVGLFFLPPGSTHWEVALPDTGQGPVFDLYPDSEGTVWVAAWNGLYHFTRLTKEKIAGIKGPVSVVGSNGNAIIAMGPHGMWRYDGKKWKEEKMLFSRQDRCILTDSRGGFYLATGKGLYHYRTGRWNLYQNEDELISDDLYGIDYSENGNLWIGGLGGITVYDTAGNKRIKSYTTDEGLSYSRVRCVSKAPDGSMWVGTDLGVVRFYGDSASLRHSRRWLPDDRVRDIAFDSRGTAWIATAGGVSAIRQKRITLVQKAAYYQNILYQRHVRKPGLVEKCRFRIPGDTTTWEPMDDDNDGQYTAMYLAMESYRYAVSHNPVARENAIKAFHALKFLQTVTGTEGFVARSVIPVSWSSMADRNEIITDRMWADREVRDPRDKRVEKHWRKSKDGKWLWKGDTSSDEITGHMYGYTIFYELIAQYDPVLKKEVTGHILKIMDDIIKNGYVLKDIDGTHTRWGVWAPGYLNHDPDWAPEKGINSLEILSYLKLAWHVSRKRKYQQEYLKLFYDHYYRDNILHAKAVAPAWRTFIDDELVALAYPALMMYEKDPEILETLRKSMMNWYAACKDDDIPYFYYTIDAFLNKEYKLGRAVYFLRDNPLDLVRWHVDNTKREDITLTHSPILEDIQTSRLVPPSERGIMRWDKNPWSAVRGDGGKTESSGVYWLLAYWMGRYYGFIE